MRRPAILLTLMLGVTALPELAAQDFLIRGLPEEAPFVPGQLIVKMRDDARLPALRLHALGLDSAAVAVRQLSGRELLYRIPRAAMAAMAPEAGRDRTLEVLDSLRADPNVEWAQLNYRVYIVSRPFTTPDVVPNDFHWADQWHYHNQGSGPGESRGGLSLPRAWEAGTGSRDVVVAILDTGVLPDHTDIETSGNLIDGYDMITDPFTANDGDGRDGDATDTGDGVDAGECGEGDPPRRLDDSWHGTHVAGTVGVGETNNNAGIAGVNWDVSVQPVRVLGKCGGTTADINDAIRWAAGLSVPGVPDNPRPAKVISMSLGTRPPSPCSVSPSTQSAIDDAVAAGAAVVVAAGNDATDASQVLPASCNGVITVAASDARGQLVERYSNYGSTVEIMAPGGDVNRDDDRDGNPDGVLSTVQGGYAYYNGTSMATPHVAGVAALWLAQVPSLTAAQLAADLQRFALPRTAAQCPDPCGAGLLNADRAGPLVTVTLNPDKSPYQRGETIVATATVTRGGVPQAGRAVSFVSANSSVLSVAQPSATTDAGGVATTTLTAASNGETRLTVSADGREWSTPVDVPDLSALGLAALVAAMAGSVVRRRRTSVGDR